MVSHPNRNANRSAFLGAVLARAFPHVEPGQIECAVFEMQRAATRAQRAYRPDPADDPAHLAERAQRSALRACSALEPGAIRLEFTPGATLAHVPGHAEPIAVYR